MYLGINCNSMELNTHGIIQSGNLGGFPFSSGIVLFLKAKLADLATNTTTTANFNAPDVNLPVTISVVSTAGFGVGYPLRIGNGGGNYLVNTIINSTEMSIRNRGGTENATPGALIISGATLSISILDSSIYNRTVIASGNARLSNEQSKYNGSSLYLDGSGDSISVPTSSDFYFGTNDFTVESWAYPQKNNALIFSTQHFSFGISPGGFLRVSNNGINIVDSNATLPFNQWTHLAASVQSGTLRLFINGVLDKTTAYIGSTAVVHNVAIGTHYDQFLYQTWQGFFSHVRVTNPGGIYTASFNPEIDTYLN